ncbi:hypothetical protein THAOC_17959 [Thalassiosira oceanica]|uniref:Uncharacterized protein n=1 Tax=Thalassiosira oceanica TaxID=159749 RepID=K0SKN7_THAOC|nr:hypothetical protein THAOC_17959 [Thalassiosira oceanica]|eukprot:EJK61536.1 hypothetical protein THAOC_17959 [Thalassiosira oceanica]
MINSQSYTLPCGRGTPRYVGQPQQDPHKSFNSIFCKRPPALAIFYVPPTIPCTSGTTRLSKVSLGARSWIEASNLPENLATQQSTHLTPTEASSNYTKLCLQTRPPPEGLGAHLVVRTNKGEAGRGGLGAATLVEVGPDRGVVPDAARGPREGVEVGPSPEQVEPARVDDEDGRARRRREGEVCRRRRRQGRGLRVEDPGG